MKKESRDGGTSILVVKRPKAQQVIALFALLLMGGGCGPDPFYLPSLAAGQVYLTLNSVPIADAIGSGQLSDEQVAKLELILDVRSYARDIIGLAVGESYTLFYDNTLASRAYNVSASDKDQFRAVTWTFPFVGTVPYVGFFDEELAIREESRLIEQGLDTFSYEVDAYSTLGFLPNPVRATFLRRDDISLADTVIHELLHNTVWRPGDSTFNESLATFVGRTGAVEYLSERFGADSAITRTAVNRFEDTDRYTAFIFELYNELDAYYASDLDREVKVAGREEIFQAARERFLAELQPLMNAPENYEWVGNLPSNNAWMLANYRYNLDLDLFEQVYAATGSDWLQAIRVFQQASGASDPKEYMRDWLLRHFAPAARRGTKNP